jgi:hypothetical protein
MNEDAVRTLLQQLGITLPGERAAAIASEIAALGPKLATTPRPTFEDEPITFQVQSRKATRP